MPPCFSSALASQAASSTLLDELNFPFEDEQWKPNDYLAQLQLEQQPNNTFKKEPAPSHFYTNLPVPVSEPLQSHHQAQSQQPHIITRSVHTKSSRVEHLKKYNSACHYCDHAAQRPGRNKIATLIGCSSPSCRKVYCNRPACMKKLPAYLHIESADAFEQFKQQLEAGLVNFICMHCADINTCKGPQCVKRLKKGGCAMKEESREEEETVEAARQSVRAIKREPTVNQMNKQPTPSLSDAEIPAYDSSIEQLTSSPSMSNGSLSPVSPSSLPGSDSSPSLSYGSSPVVSSPEQSVRSPFQSSGNTSPWRSEYESLGDSSFAESFPLVPSSPSPFNTDGVARQSSPAPLLFSSTPSSPQRFEQASPAPSYTPRIQPQQPMTPVFNPYSMSSPLLNTGSFQYPSVSQVSVPASQAPSYAPVPSMDQSMLDPHTNLLILQNQQRLLQQMILEQTRLIQQQQAQLAAASASSVSVSNLNLSNFSNLYPNPNYYSLSPSPLKRKLSNYSKEFEFEEQAKRGRI